MPCHPDRVRRNSPPKRSVQHQKLRDQLDALECDDIVDPESMFIGERVVVLDDVRDLIDEFFDGHR